MTNHEVSSYWNQYSKQGMKELLKLRLENIEAEEVEIISPNYVWDDSFSSAERLINEIIYSLGVQDKVLICLNLYNKHWVGLAIDKTSNKINISYMDSEQQKIPLLLKDKFIEALAIACPKHQINITEIEIELQRYNNCGPETIENFIAYLNGNRVSQEDAVLLHSQLLENELLFDNTQILGSNTILSTTDLF